MFIIADEGVALVWSPEGQTLHALERDCVCVGGEPRASYYTASAMAARAGAAVAVNIMGCQYFSCAPPKFFVARLRSIARPILRQGFSLCTA